MAAWTTVSMPSIARRRRAVSRTSPRKKRSARSPVMNGVLLAADNGLVELVTGEHDKTLEVVALEQDPYEAQAERARPVRDEYR